ncbi:MAG: oligopeptide/dipeptide ABC transporter ATP-binding protein [Halobacteriota archaeon]
MSDPLLEVENLHKHYPVSNGLFARLLGDGRVLRAVDGVDLTLHRGETLGVIGASGSGKSTLAETVLCLESPTAGVVKFDGEDVTAYSSRRLRQFRERAQIVFQDPYETLNPQRTVFDAVAEPLRNFRELTDDELVAAVDATLTDVGLRPAEQFRDAYPRQLSGGQRQRVTLARALALEPDLLVADEPLSMLDVSLQAGIIKLLTRLQRERTFAMLYVSHNLPVVRLLADDVGVMHRGKLVERGSADAVFEDPKHPYTRALVDSLPTPGVDRQRVRLPSHVDADSDERPSGCAFAPRCPDAMDECSRAVPALSGLEDREVACFLYHDQRTTPSVRHR